jgi:hypothetical protein
MNLKRFKLYCVFAGILVSIFLFTSPLMAEESQQKPKGLYEWLQTLPEAKQQIVLCTLEHDMELKASGKYSTAKDYELAENLHVELEAILTPEQLQSFQEIFPRRSNIKNVGVGNCESCHLPYYYTSAALNELNLAIAIFNSIEHPCDDVEHPAGFPLVYYVYTRMDWARDDLIEAKIHALDAHLNCVCDSANEAKDHLESALDHLYYAIQESYDYCSPNPPWMSNLDFSFDRVADALNSIQSCINELCNSNS